MDNLLTRLCNALKKITAQLKPQATPLSFLLLIGKSCQGKSTLLRQSSLKYYLLDNDRGANLFYNEQGIVLELGESWLNQSEQLLAYTLKKLNHCHNSLKISGIMLCIDGSDLLENEPSQLVERCQSHAFLLNRFGQALNYFVTTAIIITKLDTLVGFCEFFQSEHPQNFAKPLGFSVATHSKINQRLIDYNTKFDQVIEILGEQIINKVHPARSSIKRTLIREFPLQIASLRAPIQLLIQKLSPMFINLQAIYFTSAEQGGNSIDKINRKIEQEYALTIQNQLFQSHNYRAYFIDGALLSFQNQTMHYISIINRYRKIVIQLGSGLIALIFIGLSYHYFQTATMLDETSQELLTYETLNSSQNNDKIKALYHLALAETHFNPTLFTPTIFKTLKANLHTNTQHTIYQTFLPTLIIQLETVMTDPKNTLLDRYNALKIYLMLGDIRYFSKSSIISWFSYYWQKSLVTMPKTYNFLLNEALREPFQPITINNQLVLDARNYLNALPTSYLFYAIAKDAFPKQQIAIDILGFDLASKELPFYVTKTGFREIIAKLPAIASSLQRENWVLKNQNLANLPTQLKKAYCFDYVNWWQTFIRRTRPQHYQGFQQARQLAQTLQKSKAIIGLIDIIQQETSPELAGHYATLFNQTIANQFTALNLITTSATSELNQTVAELEKFLTTLTLINDDGRIVFDLTKKRFQVENLSDPLSVLYTKSRQLPEPIASWTKQIADDTWFIFINQSKQYINKKWQADIFPFYEQKIANRYPLDSLQKEEVTLDDFNHFFSPQGTLNRFVEHYLKPFIDVSQAQWQPKELNGYVLPISTTFINELIRANIISNMFFPNNSLVSRVEFSLQKINLDSVINNLQLTIGKTILTDNQNSESYTFFNWPESNAKLSLTSIEGNHFELVETGVWAFFNMLQKVNVLVDRNDSSSLQILFEINGNSGRYLLKTQSQINPFSPGILTGFNLKRDIV
jgi:intracellular multiplication protein IcmF